MPTPATPMPNLLQTLHSAMRFANRCVLQDLRAYCCRVTLDAPPYPGTWMDTRPMLDTREHSPGHIDMAQAGLQYALDTGLVSRHPLHAHLVCIVDTV